MSDLAVPELVEGEVPAVVFSSNPAAELERYVAVSNLLARVIRERRLYAHIRGREHVLVEGWTLLGSLIGVFPATVWTKPVDGGYQARVEARDRAGSLVGAAEALCLRAESRWRDADDYAVLSMAQTRATSKALRQPLGFVMQLAGFETTPADEMPVELEDALVDQWAPDDPVEPEPVSEPLASRQQLNRLNAGYRDHRITSRPARLEFAATVVGRDLTSSKELTAREISRVISALDSREHAMVALREQLAEPMPDPEPEQATGPSPAQKVAIYRLLEQRGLDGPARLDLLSEYANRQIDEPDQLTPDEADFVIQMLSGEGQTVMPES